MPGTRAVFVLSLFAALGAVAGSQPSLAVLQRWKLGGTGGWDYLATDQSGERLFISRGTRVDVVATKSGKIVGSIPDTQGVHGVALAPDLQRGYTSNGRSNSVTAFDLSTLRVIQEAKIPGQNPDAILYERTGRHLFTFNGTSKDFTVLDASTLAVVKTVPVPDKPEFAVDDGQGQIFVNIESEPGQMLVIDSQKLTIKAVWPMLGCNSPSGLALDGVHHRLFSVCDGRVMAVTNSTDGTQVALVPIGEHPDAAAYDVKRGLVYSSNGDGTLSVIHQDSADHYAALDTVTTQRGARTMALDAGSGNLYLVTADFGPPPPATVSQPYPRPTPIADSFVLLVVGKP